MFEGCNGTLFRGVPLYPMRCTTASVAEAPKRCIVTPRFLRCTVRAGRD